MKTWTVTSKEYQGFVSEICRQIANSDWRPDYIIGITRGGLTPAVMISHYFNVPMRSLDVSLRDNQFCVSDGGMAEDAFGYNSEAAEEKHDETLERNILLVDDINDSGATFNWIINDWEQGCLPNHPRWKEVWNSNVRFAVVVDNLGSKCEVPMDYVGFEIDKFEEDLWVDFPYEYWWK